VHYCALTAVLFGTCEFVLYLSSRGIGVLCWFISFLFVLFIVLRQENFILLCWSYLSFDKLVLLARRLLVKLGSESFAFLVYFMGSLFRAHTRQ
jgi:hypothetical protein